MKVNKFAKAELKKIFLRPIMMVLFLTIVVGLTVLSMLFTPKLRNNTVVHFTGTNIQIAFNNFMNDSNEDSKTVLDNLLTEEKVRIESFIARTENEDQINSLESKISQAEGAKQQLHSAILFYNANPSQTSQVETAFANLKSKALNVRNFLTDELTEQITFYITQNDFDVLQEFFRKMYQNIPDVFVTPNEQFLTTYQFISNNFDFNSIQTIVQNAKTFPATQVKLQPIIEKYYTKVLNTSNLSDLEPTLNNLFKTITDFVTEKSDSVLQSDFDVLNEYLSQYKSISVMSRTILQNEFWLAKAGTKTDTELKNYIGFELFNGYQLKQSSLYYNYLLDNDLFDYDYLNAFAFSQNSGTEKNAFDFVVYAMQVLSLIVGVYVLFIASGSVSNEEANGTMKMLAIRPYSRNKIITGKLLACLNLMFIMLLLCFAASFAVGYLSYGFTQTQVLLIFNANNIYILNAFVVLAIYFIATYLKLAFFITFAFMLSVITKSTTLSLITSTLVFVFSLIANSIFITSSWFSYLPLAHLDLYRYFGASSQGGIFDFNMPVNANVFGSLIYLLGTAFFFYIISLSVFKKRNIS